MYKKQLFIYCCLVLTQRTIAAPITINRTIANKTSYTLNIKFLGNKDGKHYCFVESNKSIQDAQITIKPLKQQSVNLACDCLDEVKNNKVAMEFSINEIAKETQTGSCKFGQNCTTVTLISHFEPQTFELDLQSNKIINVKTLQIGINPGIGNVVTTYNIAITETAK